MGPNTGHSMGPVMGPIIGTEWVPKSAYRKAHISPRAIPPNGPRGAHVNYRGHLSEALMGPSMGVNLYMCACKLQEQEY
jgi:hypothetical protein